MQGPELNLAMDAKNTETSILPLKKQQYDEET